jgi:hypothetical protein
LTIELVCLGSPTIARPPEPPPVQAIGTSCASHRRHLKAGADHLTILSRKVEVAGLSRRLFFAGGLPPLLGWTAGTSAQGSGHAHSGNEVKIGLHEVVLVVRGSEATLAIVDDKEQPVDASRFSAAAVVLARGNERRTLEFRPAGANRLIAPVEFPVDGKFRATVTLRGPGGDLGTGRFNVDPVR